MIASVLVAAIRRSPAITFLAVFVYILTGCSTPYQANGLMGGYSDYMVAPDEAIVTFYGNGYTSGMQVIQMTARRCAEVTLQHGYRYFVGTAASDASSNYSFTTPGYASTYGHGSAVGYGNFASGNFSSNTVITPPQTYNVNKPALTVAIKMSNDEKSLEPYGMVIAGVKSRPRDAAFLIQSLPKS
ncbi:MAG TPA: hypothetical protein VKC60_14920 [Opitutaceae bacterium]|nr:hypothetical protein [Opitutaceae bacterium]